MPDEYTLTADERSLIDELNVKANAMQQQAAGALAMVAKIHGLEGNWEYSDGVLRKQK